MGDKATKQNESNTLESAFVGGEVQPGNALSIGGRINPETESILSCSAATQRVFAWNSIKMPTTRSL